MYKKALMIIAAIMALLSVVLLYLTVVFFFKENPQLIGKYNLPLDVLSPYYYKFYAKLFLFSISLVSAAGILFIKKWGWYFFQFVNLFNLVIVLNDWLVNYQQTEELIIIIAKGICYLTIIAIHYEIKVQQAFLIDRKYNLLAFICMCVLAIFANSQIN